RHCYSQSGNAPTNLEACLVRISHRSPKRPRTFECRHDSSTIASGLELAGDGAGLGASNGHWLTVRKRSRKAPGPWECSSKESGTTSGTTRRSRGDGSFAANRSSVTG